MNIKTSLMIALIACVMLVGVAAAESPDAGSTWSTAKSFSAGSGYNYVDGTLYSGDNEDFWYSNVAAGSTVDIYLDGTSMDKGAMATMFEGNRLHSVMRHVQKGLRSGTDTTLNTAPVYVTITELYPTSNPGAYTFCLYKN